MIQFCFRQAVQSNFDIFARGFVFHAIVNINKSNKCFFKFSLKSMPKKPNAFKLSADLAHLKDMKTRCKT